MVHLRGCRKVLQYSDLILRALCLHTTQPFELQVEAAGMTDEASRRSPT